MQRSPSVILILAAILTLAVVLAFSWQSERLPTQGTGDASNQAEPHTPGAQRDPTQQPTATQRENAAETTVRDHVREEDERTPTTCTLQGRVVDEDGTPLEAVRVQISHAPSADLTLARGMRESPFGALATARTTTTSDGRFTADLWPSAIAVDIRLTQDIPDGGHRTRDGKHSLHGLLNERLAPGATVDLGDVVWPGTTDPVNGIEGRVVDADDTPQSALLVQVVKTPASDPQNWTMSARGAKRTPAAGSHVVADFDADAIPHAQTSHDGRFSILAVPEGHAVVRVIDPRDGRVVAARAIRHKPGLQEIGDLVLHAGRVHGRVVDADSLPVPGAEIVAGWHHDVRDTILARTHAWWGQRAVTADHEGRFSLDHVPVPLVPLAVRRGDGHKFHVEFCGSEGTEEVVLTLPEERTVVVTVVDAEGQPVLDLDPQRDTFTIAPSDSIGVEALGDPFPVPIEDFERDPIATGQLEIDREHGRLILRGLPSSMWLAIERDARDGHPAVGGIVGLRTRGATEPITLRLDRTQIRVDVVDGEGRGIENALVQTYPRRMGALGAYRTSHADADGRAHVLALVGAPWQLRVAHPAYGVRRRNFDVEEQPTTVRFMVSGRGRVIARVTLETGILDLPEANWNFALTPRGQLIERRVANRPREARSEVQWDSVLAGEHPVRLDGQIAGKPAGDVLRIEPAKIRVHPDRTTEAELAIRFVPEEDPRGRATVRGSVTVSGEPLAEGSVRVSHTHPQIVAVIEDGRFQIDAAPTGTWHFTVNGPGGTFDQIAERRVHLEPGAFVDLDFELVLATVRARVEAPELTPDEIVVFSASLPNFRYDAESHTFVCEHAKPGTHRIEAGTRGGTLWAEPVSISVTEDSKVVETALRIDTVIRTRLRVVGEHATLCKQAERAFALVGSTTLQFDEQLGFASSRSLRPGAHSVRVFVTDRNGTRFLRSTELVHVAEGAATDVVLELRDVDD